MVVEKGPQRLALTAQERGLTRSSLFMIIILGSVVPADSMSARAFTGQPGFRPVTPRLRGTDVRRTAAVFRRTVTRDRIGDDLTALGLGPGDTVMFHTRLSAIGYVPGGPQTVIDALLHVVGPTGTLMASCGWNDAPPYDLTTSPSAWQARSARPPSRVRPGTERGRAHQRPPPEALRRRPGAVRSRHP